MVVDIMFTHPTGARRGAWIVDVGGRFPPPTLEGSTVARRGDEDEDEVHRFSPPKVQWAIRGIDHEK